MIAVQLGGASKKADAHADAVWSLAWLNDTSLLSGSVDGTLKCWKFENQEISGPKWVIEGEFQMGVISICKLSDSEFAASSMDGCIRICNSEGKIIRRIEAGPVDCWSLCASSDGTEIASGTYTGSVNIWNVKTGEIIKTLETNGTFGLSIARFENTIALGTKDGSVYQINIDSGEVLPTKGRIHHLPVRALCYSHDGSVLYTASDDGLANCVSTLGGEKIGVMKGHLSWVLGIACSKTSIATASADRRIRIWDPETKECLVTFDAHSGHAFSLAFHPTGSHLVSGGAGGEIQTFKMLQQ